MSRGKQREPFEGARRSGEVEIDETLKLTHKLTAVDEADAIETAKGFPAVDWSLDDDLVIELPNAVAPVLAVTPEIELGYKDLVGYKVELEDKDVIGLDDQFELKEQVVFEQPIRYLEPVEELSIKYDGVDGESTSADHKGEVAFDVKGEIDLDTAPVFEEFEPQWSAGAEGTPIDVGSQFDELVDLADPIELPGLDG